MRVTVFGKSLEWFGWDLRREELASQFVVRI
jgi:hypothetical protein